jgi:hypothetical protein
VHTNAQDTAIPGLQLLHDFITPDQEQRLLAAVDAAPWQALAKRRVQHYGFDFKYDQRGVDPGQTPQELPGWVQPVLKQIQVGVGKIGGWGGGSDCCSGRLTPEDLTAHVLVAQPLHCTLLAHQRLKQGTCFITNLRHVLHRCAAGIMWHSVCEQHPGHLHV